MPSVPTATPDTTHLPRLLCLHGGGVNATIFKVQSRSLVRHLQHSFRLVWADAPFYCDPHPDIVGVYGSYAPFRRWHRWLPEHANIDDESCIDEIGYALRTAMEDDDREGGTGEWVGLMGFSQGAKLSASLLLEQQAREQQTQRNGLNALKMGLIGLPGISWRFGILLAGRAPPTNLNPEIMKSRALVGAAELSDGFQFSKVDEDAIIDTPTLHVHGRADPGIHLHQKLLHDYCKEGTKMLVEWDGAHRIPIKSSDVDRVVDAIYDVAERTGVAVLRTV
jgi:predicted esterase